MHEPIPQSNKWRVEHISVGLSSFYNESRLVEIQYFWIARHQNIFQVVLDYLDNSCFLLSSMLQSYSSPLCTLIFFGTRPLANSENSSVVKLKHLETVEVGQVEWLGGAEMGRTARHGGTEEMHEDSWSTHISRDMEQTIFRLLKRCFSIVLPFSN